MDKLIWQDKYSVKVKEIDDQHKKLIEVINDLVEALHSNSREEDLKEIMRNLLEYKANHFKTEEKYFHQFSYEGTAAHEEAHRIFGEKIIEIQNRNSGNTISFAFDLVDYLEDWLVNHLMSLDQMYVTCFSEHGLH